MTTTRCRIQLRPVNTRSVFTAASQRDHDQYSWGYTSTPKYQFLRVKSDPSTGEIIIRPNLPNSTAFCDWGCRWRACRLSSLPWLGDRKGQVADPRRQTMYIAAETRNIFATGIPGWFNWASDECQGRVNTYICYVHLVRSCISWSGHSLDESYLFTKNYILLHNMDNFLIFSWNCLNTYNINIA